MKSLNIICSMLLMFIGIGCNNEQSQDFLDEERADFTLTVYAPKANKTRAITTDGVTPPATIEDKLADGWAFNHLTFFAVNKKDKIVIAYRDVDFPNDAKEMTTFDLNQDIEGNLVDPKEGAYELYFIANYSQNTSLKNAINGVLNELKKTSTKGKGLDTTTSGTWTTLMNQTITIGTANLANKRLMPLSLKTEVLLKPGKNHFDDIHLVRTFSRIIVEIRNESQIHNLIIKNFGFNTNFTTTSIPVFSDGTLQPASAKPDVKSTEAITPFTPTDGGTVAHLAPNKIYTLFDGYFLESKEAAANEGYKFNLKVGIPSYYLEGAAQDHMDIGNSYYLKVFDINGPTFKYYAHVNDNSTVVSTPDAPNLLDPEACKSYIFKAVKGGTDAIFIISKFQEDKGLNKYVDGLSSNAKIGFNRDGRDLITKSNNIYWDASEWPNSLHHYIDSDLLWKETTNGAPGYKRFDFIPVTQKTADKQSIIPFKYLIDGNPVKVSEITRNSFLHILFNVRYNDKFGNFEFSVEKWTDVNGDIEFN